jgi:nucleoside-diphosphate-sugar epimerase
MRTVIIGGTGHVGTYLVPRLVEAGHEVVCLSRGQREPYQPHAAWDRVERIQVDREAEDEAGTFGERVRALEPDAVIDMICFTPESARHLVDVLRGRVGHFLHCGTIWVHGPSVEVPTTEARPRRPFGEYGIQKAAIEAYLLDEFHPRVFAQLARGEELALPNLGLETVHHVHADDVAQAFMRPLANWSGAVGESFHIVSPAALTLRGYAESMAAWLGQPARLRYLPWEAWRATVSEEEADATWDHIAHSPNCSIDKARRVLDYRPRYSSLQAVTESVSWLIEHEGILEPASPPFAIGSERMPRRKATG